MNNDYYNDLQYIQTRQTVQNAQNPQLMTPVNNNPQMYQQQQIQQLQQQNLMMQQMLYQQQLQQQFEQQRIAEENKHKDSPLSIVTCVLAFVFGILVVSYFNRFMMLVTLVMAFIDIGLNHGKYHIRGSVFAIIISLLVLSLPIK